MELPSDTIENELTRATKIRAFQQEFTKIASDIAKIIINEQNQKSIKPASVGGVAGNLSKIELNKQKVMLMFVCF